jgi:peptide/nickel transport system substrate-binding protein
VVFEKVSASQAAQESASWLAGGKPMLVDRVGWVVIPDPGTAAAVLHGGEVDWSTTCGERKPRDLGFVRSYAR